MKKKKKKEIMIPQYSRLNSAPSTSFLRRSFRTREKCLILLVFLTFCFVCFGGFFYLPDDFGTDKVIKVYKQFQKAGPEIFIPAPPIAHHHGGGGGGHNGMSDEEDPHIVGDRAKLNAKIQEELGDILEKPDTLIMNHKQTKPQAAPPLVAAAVIPSSNDDNDLIENKGTNGMKFNLVNGEDRDPVNRERRNRVKDVSGFLFFN